MLITITLMSFVTLISLYYIIREKIQSNSNQRTEIRACQASSIDSNDDQVKTFSTYFMLLLVKLPHLTTFNVNFP